MQQPNEKVKECPCGCVCLCVLLLPVHMNTPRASCFSAFGHWMVPVLLLSAYRECKVELEDR
jgi:hypothetical protein